MLQQVGVEAFCDLGVPAEISEATHKPRRPRALGEIAFCDLGVPTEISEATHKPRNPRALSEIWKKSNHNL